MNYIVATIKSWNINNFENFFGKKSNFYLIDNKKNLTKKIVEKISPRYIFFPHWSWIIPREIYEKYICVVFHMTDLPFGRGGSPLQNLIVRGIYKTKICAIKVDFGIDNGPIYIKRDFNLEKGSAQELYTKSSKKIFDMICEIIAKNPVARPQRGRVVNFKRRTPKESEIPSSLGERGLYDFIRMLDAEGYQPAYLEKAGLRFEFRNAKLDNKQISAEVKINKVT